MQKIEDYTREGLENWAAIEEEWPNFIADYKKLHLEVVKIYIRLYPDKKPFCESFYDAVDQINATGTSMEGPTGNFCIDSVNAISQFGEETFINNINDYLKNFFETKKKLEFYFKEKKHLELMNLVQNLKTRVR